MNSTRRQFISRTSTAVAGLGLGLSLAPRIYAQSKGANERVVMGLIGCGGMGRENMKHFLDLGISIAAICDVDDKHLDRAQKEVTDKGQPAP
ncbi:MAG: twin-arginine translocation signal domain-containing protein, partial [Limisphaerales bacterium]